MPSDLDRVNEVVLVVESGERRLVGTLGAGWNDIDLMGEVVHVWGRAIGVESDGRQIAAWEAMPGGEIQVLHRSAFGADATTLASITRSGELLVISGPSTGMRVAHLATGNEKEVIPSNAALEPLFSPVEWSPSGSRGVAASCTEVSCTSHVLDPAGPGTVSFDLFVPSAIAGTTILGYAEVTDPTPLLLDIETGLRMPAGSLLTKLWDATAITDDRILAWGTVPDGDFGYVVLDIAAGTEQLVALDREERHPLSQFVDPAIAILAPRDGGIAPGGALDLLDLTTGRIEEAVIAVPPAP